MAKKKVAAAQTAEDEQPSFERALEDLESIVRRLEAGGDSLESALDDYAKAITLLKRCHQQLEKAERKIEVLSGVDAEGNVVAEPLEMDEEQSLEDKQQNRGARRTATKSAAKKRVSKKSPADGESPLFD